MPRQACEEATSSDRLAAVLERVLDIGNLLNEGEGEQVSSGREMESLLRRREERREDAIGGPRMQ